jgi:hypothetical protein
MLQDRGTISMGFENAAGFDRDERSRSVIEGGEEGI